MRRAARLALVLLLAGCGSSSSPTEPAAVPTSTPTPTPVPTQSNATSLSGVISLLEKDGTRSAASGAVITVTGFGIQTATGDAAGAYLFPATLIGGLPFNIAAPPGKGGLYACPGGTLATHAGGTIINFDCPHQ